MDFRKKVKFTFLKHSRLLKFNFVTLVSFLMIHFFWLQPLIVYAKTKPKNKTNGSGSGQKVVNSNVTNGFQLQAPKSNNAISFLSNYLYSNYYVAAQGLVAVILIFCCISLGARIGIASAFGQSNTRTDCLISLGWVVFAALITINARAIVGTAG